MPTEAIFHPPSPLMLGQKFKGTVFNRTKKHLHLHTSLFRMKFADVSSFEGSAKTRDELQDYVNLELVKVSNRFKTID